MITYHIYGYLPSNQSKDGGYNIMSIYDYKVKDIDGNDVEMEEFRGKTLLILNSATNWGFTKQYEALEELYKKYKDEGFEILDFPSDQFGQTPGTNAEVKQFGIDKYGITFRQFSKIEVNGENEEPLFTYLKERKTGLGGKNIKWNFTKFLVAKDGNIIDRFPPMMKPEKLEKKIKNLLK